MAAGGCQEGLEYSPRTFVEGGTVLAGAVKRVDSRCALCGKSREQVKELIPGIHGAVCRSCIETHAQAAQNQTTPSAAPAIGDAAPATDVPATAKPLSRPAERDRWLSLLVVLAVFVLVGAVLAVAVHLLAAVGHTLLLFSLGCLLAYALDPLVERLRGRLEAQRRRSRAACVLAVLFAAFLLVATACALLSATLVRQVNILSTEHSVYEARARDALLQADARLAAGGAHLNLTSMLSHPPPSARSWGEAVAKGAIRFLESLSRDLVEGLLVVIIAVYFLLGSEEMAIRSRRSVPEWARAHFRIWQDDVNRVLGGFVRGQFLLALCIGTMAAVLCCALGLRLWLLIGLFVVVAALVPVVGPIIGVAPAIVAALVSPNAHFDPMVRVAILLAAFVLINEFGSKILYPRLVGAALGLHEILVLFVLLAGFEVGGLVGVLFAAPLTALALVTIAHIYRLWQGFAPASVAGGDRHHGRIQEPAAGVQEGHPIGGR